jgi:hypothetical protein
MLIILLELPGIALHYATLEFTEAVLSAFRLSYLPHLKTTCLPPDT